MTPWGRCAQPAELGRRLCLFHIRPMARVDEYYHRKVALGMLSLTDHYTTKAQQRALMYGRRHRDGRQTDEWVV